MCNFKSGLIFKNRVVLAPENNESHSNLLESLGIKDTRENAMRMFIRAELIPKDGNKALPVDKWTFKVDQDITPDWYDEDPKRYETDFRNAVREYMKNRILVICGYPWTPIKRDGNRIYYLMDGTITHLEFGKNNNYAESNVREYLNKGDLAEKLRKEFGDKLVPITTDMLSLDGLDDYGKVEGDILAIPTLDLYRECRKNIPKVDNWWWLATPNSTPSGYGSGDVLCVNSGGFVGYDWYDCCKAVRPFFILES